MRRGAARARPRHSGAPTPLGAERSANESAWLVHQRDEVSADTAALDRPMTRDGLSNFACLPIRAPAEFADGWQTAAIEAASSDGLREGGLKRRLRLIEK